MQHTLNGKTYHMASKLNDFQERLYSHLIDWKHENLNVTAPGYHGGHRYDYLFPDEYIGMHPIPPPRPTKSTPDRHQIGHNGTETYTFCNFAS